MPEVMGLHPTALALMLISCGGGVVAFIAFIVAVAVAESWESDD